MDHAVGPAATVLKHVQEIIDTGGLKPGDRLPTERDLAAATGVGRAAVRAALQDLEARGIVLRHVGRGTFVAPDNTTRPSGAAHQASPAEIMASRLVLEPELMPLAVASATGADLAEMERCLRGGEQAAGSEEFERWDTALHHSFALATHNEVLISVSSLLIDARRQPVWGGLKRRSFTPERHRCYCTEHEQIVTAVRERDPQAARDAMRTHLHHVRRVLLGDHL
ncbi:transcriptional regulator [Streptomyces hygroscopicus subsp. sporocinereus]|uniref:Transcriptional regulator n=1 Tax=Streptomyces hygroscopicus TaxID=1912 RepID=A0ABQ3TTM9_STRHY|nr:FCD domain-containing protein [Streptomyces hygroscopicus]GHJ26696.1 transcriptional regulator [Streptomyces hygroscopicus]